MVLEVQVQSNLKLLYLEVALSANFVALKMEIPGYQVQHRLVVILAEAVVVEGLIILLLVVEAGAGVIAQQVMLGAQEAQEALVLPLHIIQFPLLQGEVTLLLLIRQVR